MAKKTKYEHLIVFFVLLGLFTLFIFPEPETNFLAYVATAALFVLIIILLIKRKNKK